MKKRFLRYASAMLAIVMIVGVLPLGVFAEGLSAALSAAEEPIVVVAGSDFQSPNGHGQSSANVNAILIAIRQKYPSAYGLLFAGDYDYDYDTSEQGKDTLAQTVEGSGLGIEDYVFTQGNHDPDELVSSGVLSPSGNNDTDHYGVFVINEKDYMHQNTDEATVAATAEALDKYLSAKAAEGYKKPIFVVSHLPLHYSMRTYRDGDARYADKLIKVLNNHAAGDGLDIIYLYGHDHSHGWDDYLGGSSVFLRPGNVLPVADGTKTGYDRYTLKFTYMNAGFTGYYEDMGSGVDTALTMTTFAIYEDRVEINRFDASGLHNLKAKGNYGADYGLDEVERTMYDPSARIYENSETISLKVSNNVQSPEYGPETVDHGWIHVDSSETSIWRYSQSLTKGERYLISNSYSRGDRKVIAFGENKLTQETVTVLQNNHDGNYIESATDSMIWTYDGSRFTHTAEDGTVYYLMGNDRKQALSFTTNKNDNYTTWKLDSKYGLYTGSGNQKYYIRNTFVMGGGSRTNRVYLMAEETTSTPSLYASFLGSSGVTIPAGVYGSYDALKHVIRESFSIFTATDTKGTNKKIVHDYTIEGTADPTTAGNYTLSIRYNGVEITKYVVTVKARAISSITCDPMVGSASSDNTNTGSILHVTYSDGTSARQHVTTDMLEGDFNLRKPGVYEDLTIVYADQRIPGYTLNVYVNNYPEFPHEGSIRVNKGTTAIDFNNTGVARVELSATGVPVKRGADVIIMLDTSSSMRNNYLNGVSRQEVLTESLSELIAELQRDGEDGEPMDIRVSIADFNNYLGSGYPYYLESKDHLVNASTQGTSSSVGGNVYTGKGTMTADSLVSVHDLDVRNGVLYKDEGKTPIRLQTTHSGTNYDYAFDVVYQITSSVKQANEEAHEDRDLFVIFMSDGAPYQYNYFSGSSSNSNWNNWLTGTVTDSMFDRNANKNYYNPEGKHWMAEAIKGDPAQRYTVVRKNTNGLEGYLEATDKQNIYTLPGLGATMFSIGFCLAKDNRIELETMRTVLRNISSNKDLLYYEANTADDLHNAFHMIGQEINYAATDAYFVDTMGKQFDLQMSRVDYRFLNSEGRFENRSILPEIKFTLYGLYTHADVEAGIIPHDKIGTRNGMSTVVETVTFNADGTEAYSSIFGGNIMQNGVIYARHFWYNTNDYSVMIDSDLDGTEDYLLANESFYWDMGTINQHDMVLSYYVYLDGSMEGELEPGTYNTNQSAILYYTNWLGNDAYRETVSPQIPWQAASVRYAFYLVDENGLSLVNQEMGMTGSFANRLNITTPTFYALLNSMVSLNAAELAAQDLPEGYELYDKDATYTVHVRSALGASAWTIGKGNVPTSSTYVTGHDSYQFTNELEEDDPAYDYTHTIVWFAVVYTVKPVSDVVVIDYGQPVNIQALLNDMFYNKGGIVAVGPHTTSASVNGEAHLSASFVADGTLRTVYEGKFGTATITPNGIRYALRQGVGTNMTEPEIFSYAVLYESRYYYGTITVIPAANMYFEEDFLTFEDSSAATDTLGVWTDVGTADPNAPQSVDRPGFNNLASLDANNVYGFDPSYTSCATFSNGGAKAVTVNLDLGNPRTAPTATFTFTGTGFDIISLTDNVGATILVTVYDKDGHKVASKSVNNYYGYTYSEEEGWQPNASSEDTVWQVPVIKLSGLEQAAYTVKISVIFLESVDYLYPDGTSTFVLDSIRIYDPAKGNETADNAHKADKEYAPFYMTMKDLVLGIGEIRDQETLPGVVFIDGKDATVSIKDYENPGPNNELYLAKGQGISFKLTATAIPTATHIGVKMAVGTDGVIKHGAHDFLHVHGAANMFYPMNHITWTPVTDENGEVAYYETPVITFSHSDREYFHDTSSVISFTGFKFTFEQDGVMVRPVVDPETLSEGIEVMALLYSSGAPEADGGASDGDKPVDGDETEIAPPAVEPLPDDGDGQPPVDNLGQPDGEQTAEDETADETEPADGNAPVTDTDPAPVETDGARETEGLTEEPTEDLAGCGSVIGTGSLVAIAMLAAYVFVGRKRS